MKIICLLVLSALSMAAQCTPYFDPLSRRLICATGNGWTRTGTDVAPTNSGDTVTIGTTVIDPTAGIKGPIIACAASPGDTTAPYRALCVTTAGAAYVCANAAGCVLAEDWAAQAGSVYPGVASDGDDGLTITGALEIGAGEPTQLRVTCAYIGAGSPALPAANSVTAGTHMQVCDGLTAADSTVGGGSNVHWVYSTGAAWVSENSVGPTGATGAAGAAVVAPTALSTTCAGTVNWAVGSVGIASATITTTGSCNLTLSGMLAGGFYTVLVTQGAGGSHTLALGTGGTGGCTAWKVGGGGSGAVTPTAAAGSKDVLAIWYDGTDCYANYRGDFN